MADRTWNKVEARLYDEWQLPKHSRLILAHIIALSPNQYGIYDPSPYGRIREWWADIITDSQFNEAWEALISSGKIVEFRDRDCLWLVKKFKHEQCENLNQNQRKGVRNFLKSCPEIAEAFTGLYSLAVATPLKPHSNGIDTPSKGDSKGYELSDTDTDITEEILILAEGEGVSKGIDTPLATRQKKKPKPKDVIKAKPLYEETIKLYPPECENARGAFESMCAASNASGEISKQRLAGILAEILERTKGMTPAQINYGFYAATKKGAPNANYVFKAATGYTETSDYFHQRHNGQPEPIEEEIIFQP